MGLPLCAASRAVDMATFGFGRMVEGTFRGRPSRRPEFSLHVQCQWRVVRDGAILVGYGDWHWPPHGSATAYDAFIEADAPRNRRDDLVDAFVGHGEAAHVVEVAEGATTGDLRLGFVDGCVLEVFPNFATPDESNGHDEYWRLLPPGERSGHFVVTAHGTDS